MEADIPRGSTVISISEAESVTGFSNVASSKGKKESSGVIRGMLGLRMGCKLWVIVAILALAGWSMFAGSLTLEWASVQLSRISAFHDTSLEDDLDVLEVEEKEKVVKHLWGLYAQGTGRGRLPTFWVEAFYAAYNDLASDVPSVHQAAISEIAKLSIRSRYVNTHPSLAAVS